MRFYNHPHAFYCGVDLHARSMFTHILDHAGNTAFERDLSADPGAFMNAMAPNRAGLVGGVECMFTWYWLADLCATLKAFGSQLSARATRTIQIAFQACAQVVNFWLKADS